MTGLISAISSGVRHRSLAPGTLRIWSLKCWIDFCAGIRVEVALTDAATDLAWPARQRPTAALDLVSEELEAVCTCTIRVFSAFSVTPSVVRIFVASANAGCASARV